MSIKHIDRTASECEQVRVSEKYERFRTLLNAPEKYK
jgi:hypothetical protein